MADNVDEKHVLAVLPAFLDWWRGDEGDDTPYAICGAILAALRSLPVEQRMEAMGMREMLQEPPVLHSVDVGYCLTHHGVRIEGDEWCSRRDEVSNDCETCSGAGAIEDVNPWVGTFDCADCDGYGSTRCDLRELVWMETP